MWGPGPGNSLFMTFAKWFIVRSQQSVVKDKNANDHGLAAHAVTNG